MPEFYLSIGSIIIDDIVMPDGRKKIGILGGGLTHAAMGMRVWTDQVGLISSVGGDFDRDQIALLKTYFDTSGICINKEVPTPRAWQVFDEDGTRHETFQTDFSQMAACIPKHDDLSDNFNGFSGIHLQCPPHEVALWVRTLRTRGCCDATGQCQVILWEPWDEFCIPENKALFKQNSMQVDIVSPNLREARILTGLNEPLEIMSELRDYGARVVALRMAEAGSLVLDQHGVITAIPAYPINKIIDVTGAGNAYCGGFVVGYARTGNVEKAGWYGGVSASLTLHQFGALYPLDGLDQEANSRLNWYRKNSILS